MMLAFLVAMAWKSGLIAGAALAFAFILGWRSASERLILLRTGVAMLLALPLIMAFLPALQIVAFAAPESPVAPYPTGGGVEAVDPRLVGLPMAVSPVPSLDSALIAVIVYLAGLALLAARQLVGLIVLQLWTRAAEPATSPEWLGVLDGLTSPSLDGRPVRLLVSADVKSPLSWGWLHPVILIDPDTLHQPEDAEAILIHEVTHIVRRDWPALMLARLAVILFWFNPLVWLLERELVQQSEQAADLEAADRVGAAHYAEKLLVWARFGTRVPANSIAASTSALGRRVRNILDGNPGKHRPRGAWAGVATLLSVGFATPIAAMQLVAATPEPPKTLPRVPPAIAPVTVPPSSAATAAASAPAPSVPATPVVQAPRREPDRRVDAPAAPRVPEMPDIGATVAVALAEADLPRIQQEVAQAVGQAQVARQAGQAHRQRARPEYPQAGVAPWTGMTAWPTGDWSQMVASAMAGSAAGMEAGAARMEAQADNMERMGSRFRTDRAYREQAIERSRRWGRAVSHDELIEAGKGMQDGARGMRKGAREMREAAARMRHVGTD